MSTLETQKSGEIANRIVQGSSECMVCAPCIVIEITVHLTLYFPGMARVLSGVNSALQDVCTLNDKLEEFEVRPLPLPSPLAGFEAIEVFSATVGMCGCLCPQSNCLEGIGLNIMCPQFSGEEPNARGHRHTSRGQ